MDLNDLNLFLASVVAAAADASHFLADTELDAYVEWINWALGVSILELV